MGFTLENRGQGSWRVTISDGYEGAKQRRLRRTVRVDPSMTIKAQEREAGRLAAELETDYRRHKLTIAKKVTLEDFSVEWMENYARRKGLSPRTIYSYEYLLKSRILPSLGKVYIQDITPTMLNRFYCRLEKEKPRTTRANGDKLSGTYAQKYHGLLYSMLERAVKWQYISVNPASAAEPPREDTKEFKPYTDEQVILLMDALEQEDLQWRTFFTLAMHSQMRRGELVGLDWASVDFDRQCVKVIQSASYVPKEGQLIKDPKTAAGKRTVYLPASTMRLLKEHKADQNAQRLEMGETWIDEGAVFTQWNGKRMQVDTPSSKFRKMLKSYGLPVIRLHDLRHTGATLLISGDNPMDPVTISKRMGHSRTSTTLDIYAHAFEKQDQAVPNVLEEALNNARQRMKRKAK